MPKRTDLRKIMIIGSGPIVIGQACEFDYSGTQACKALREEGYEVVLVNSNPATIMTDPNFANATYVEPINPEVVEKIIAKERPDALLPTVGGQTALNTAMALGESGVLDRYGVELIGANLKAIKKGENREQFKQAMADIGLSVPQSGVAHSEADAREIIARIGYPAIIRPSFTMGGTGGGIAYTEEDYFSMVNRAISESPTKEVLIEQSVLGWKEFELEVMRDHKDNVVIICSIENFDPMGVHTGDSITVAPAQTLTDKEYQIMRDAAKAIIREIGVDTGGSNIQFAINPENGAMIVIEMNPRVSRSSALASKATGFPIAKIAAKLAVGYTLDELSNDITRETPASFEPTLDYVITKIPRFTFEKFPQAENYLTTQMKSVGEVMGVGRTFKESLQKAIRSLEVDKYGFDSVLFDEEKWFSSPTPLQATVRQIEALSQSLKRPNSERLWQLGDAIRVGLTNEEIFELTAFDPWFVENIREIIEFENELKAVRLQQREMNADLLRQAKEMGFSDRRIAKILGVREEDIRNKRFHQKIVPVYKVIDTCAAEFKAYTPYLYSTYEDEDESAPSDKKKVMILGGGPNRIGQGIEFDYCCVHGVFALQEAGYETIMVNCNPETVSTDYDTSDKLYFEPLTLEDVLNIVHREKPFGVIVQFGGQTPLKLALGLEKAGVPIIGTSPDSIDIAEDRERFQQLVEGLKLLQPANGMARSNDEALSIAKSIGYPVVVRPSYVLGGRAMEIVHDEGDLVNYMERAVKASPEHPVLIDKFLEDATELDVDLISDGKQVVIGAIMEHIEEAGIHSGDSACAIPPFSMDPGILEKVADQSKRLGMALNVVGLMNIQFAIAKNKIYLLEANPRASRTVPFVSKTIGVSLAKLAARVMAGETLEQLKFTSQIHPNHVAVKEAVFPFTKFPNVDSLLGPEMRSTGEVMGIDSSMAMAFAKAQIAAGTHLPRKGTVFISVRDKDKKTLLESIRRLTELQFNIVATRGTHEFLVKNGIASSQINKVKEGHPHIVDRMKMNEVAAVFNTTEGKESIADSFSIRRTAIMMGIPYFTTVSAATAAVQAIEALVRGGMNVKSLQEYLPAK